MWNQGDCPCNKDKILVQALDMSNKSPPRSCPAPPVPPPLLGRPQAYEPRAYLRC